MDGFFWGYDQASRLEEERGNHVATVLAADDEDNIRKLVKAYLTADGAQVSVFFRRYSPDLTIGHYALTLLVCAALDKERQAQRDLIIQIARHS